MRIGFIGLGKLGLPCAVAAALKGHDVIAYDAAPGLMNRDPRPYRETGPDGHEPFDPYLQRSTIRFGSMAAVVAHADIVFVAVQTPHDAHYEGITRLRDEPKDFDYGHLVSAVRQIAEAATRPVIVSVISTVLPGTVRRLVLPLENAAVRLCYNPFFIAMGTTMRDFLDPEFVLLGVDDGGVAETMTEFYTTITAAPVHRMSIESAELTKVAYNTFIGMKIAYANTLMEICHKTPGADVDDVVRALKGAHRRLISGRYLEGGMGDGGGCHPRDNIALSWLADRLSLSHDLFRDVMTARERQTEWLADLMCEHALPKAIIGYSFKAESNLIVGSPALLLRALLKERGIEPLMYDPIVDGSVLDLSTLPPHVFLLGARHPEFHNTRFPSGSVVIDPWRYLPAHPDDVTMIRVGIGRRHVDD